MQNNLDYRHINMNHVTDKMERINKIKEKIDSSYLVKNKRFVYGRRILPEMPEGLNISIQLLFHIIGNPEKGLEINEWNVIPLNECLKIYNDYLSKSQTKIFDIATQYMGMGHYNVLSCDLNTHKLFIHTMGGGEYYASQANYNEAINLDPAKYKQWFFYRWFYTNDLNYLFETKL